MQLTRGLILVAGSSLAVFSLVVACGSSDGSKFDDGSNGSSSGDTASGGVSSGGAPITGTPGTEPDGGDPYANDPIAQWCGVDGGAPVAPPVSGTEECPSDKNKPGCACDTPGATAPCWTGLRANRGLGQCKDGVTTCQRKDEITYAWGDCVGEVLPEPGATKGAAACRCFSQGQWKIANLSPCSETYNTTTYAISSTDSTDPPSCPTPVMTPTAPSVRWSADTLDVDCAGHFNLCYTIKQGDFKNPQPTDCVVAKVCSEGDYTTANVEQTWPDLPGWLGPDPTCAAKWNAYFTDSTKIMESPGYGEMTVQGLSERCDKIDDGAGGMELFNRVQYCPFGCQSNPSDPACAACSVSGSGTF